MQQRSSSLVSLRLGGDLPVELCHGATVGPDALRHLHEDFRFGVAVSGRWTSRYRGIAHSVAPGGVQFAQPGEVSACEFHRDADSSFRVLVLPPEGLATVYEDVFERHPGDLHFADHIIGDRPAWRFFTDVHRRLMGPTSGLERSTTVRTLIASLLLRYSASMVAKPARSHPQGLKRARDYLADQLAANPDVEELASVAGLSPFHFSRSFKQAFGLPPHAYQNHLRVKRAKELLEQGWAAGDIAHHLGFNDQSHFIRHFRRQTGTTPLQYARSARNA